MCLATQFKDMRTNYRWECRHGHQWDAPIHPIIYNNAWCPECYRNKVLKPLPANMFPAKVAIIKRGKSPIRKASYIKGDRRWKHGDIHPENGKYFWAYDIDRRLSGGKATEFTRERWLNQESFEHRRARKLLIQRRSKADNRPQPHLRVRKHGDIHPQTGMVFWAYERTHKSGERWVTREYFEKAKKEIKRIKMMEHRVIVRRGYEKLRNETDPIFRLRKLIRTSIFLALRKYAGAKSRPMLENTLGCTIKEFRIHLEKQFQPGMSWKNHGRGGGKEFWHVDHMTPLASAKTIEQVMNLHHYTTLRPLWAEENIAKGARDLAGKLYKPNPYDSPWRRKAMPIPPRARSRSPAPT